MTGGGIFETSEDAVLGGRLRLRQPLRGHRVGHDAILLAAATGGRAGEHAVDLGAGIGAAGLALAARVPGLKITLVEIDQTLCDLAAGNARLNGLADRVDVLVADAAGTGLSPGRADRVLMNPPFHDATKQNLSPDPHRRLAYAAAPGLLQRWVAAAALLLKPQGVLTLIWRADALADVQSALAVEFGGIAVLSVLPRAGANAIRVLVRAVKSGRGAPMTYPALVLNDEQGRPTAAAEAVLRGGDTLGISET
ncbi:MAG TPA: methyltransferase [Pseudolabrys sp.]|nr:methyltransferase [Pseudolabrys sp.]